MKWPSQVSPCSAQLPTVYRPSSVPSERGLPSQAARAYERCHTQKLRTGPARWRILNLGQFLGLCCPDKAWEASGPPNWASRHTGAPAEIEPQLSGGGSESHAPRPLQPWSLGAWPILGRRECQPAPLDAAGDTGTGGRSPLNSVTKPRFVFAGMASRQQDRECHPREPLASAEQERADAVVSQAPSDGRHASLAALR